VPFRGSDNIRVINPGEGPKQSDQTRKHQTPPGRDQNFTPPGKGGTPPGHERKNFTPPRQGTTPSGQGKESTPTDQHSSESFKGKGKRK